MSATIGRFRHFALPSVAVGAIIPASSTASEYWTRTIDGTKELPPLPPLPEIPGPLGALAHAALQPIHAQMQAMVLDAKPQAEAKKELLFELVRRDDFPDRPSRSRCVWFLEDSDEAQAFWTSQGMLMQGRRVVVDVEAIEGRLHRASAKWLNVPLRASMQHHIEAARAYWRGEDASGPSTEILFEGDWRVLRLREETPPPAAGR